jgi:signal peptidase II
MIFYVIAILVVLVDQICKVLIRLNLNIDDTFSLWGIQLTHYENSGMAGSAFQGYARLFGMVAVLFIAGVIYYRKSGLFKGRINDISFGFLVGGAAGNGLDRLLFGHVTDFLVSRSGNGVLNMADHAIEIGIVLLILNSLYQWLLNWKVRRCSV